MRNLTRKDFLKMATVTIGGVAVPASAGIVRDLGFLPSAKERGPLVHSTGDVCKVGMGKCGEALPYDYEVSYITCDGSGRYFDTGVEATGDLSVDFECTSSYKSNESCCGAIIKNGDSYLRHHYTPYNFCNYWYAGVEINTKPFNENIFNHINLDAHNGILKIDEVERQFSVIDFETGINYYIFARNSFGTSIQTRQSSFRSFKMSKNGNKIRDFICVVKNDIAFLFDKVESKLYEQKGSGNLMTWTK